LGALCEDEGKARNAVVLASDRMVTFPGIIEFEHAVPKMHIASTRAAMLVAGDALVGTRLVRDVIADPAIQGQSVAGISAYLAQQYASVRLAQMENQVLAARGLSLGSFYASHASLQQQVVFGLDQAMAGHNLGVEVLIGGVDADGGHLFTVHNPGGSDLQHDVISYAGVGSGWLQAIQSMIGFAHSGAEGLNETVFRVYASKRRAEVAPGVGHDTDLIVIRQQNAEKLSKETLDDLDKLYLENLSSTSASLQAKLDKLVLKEVSTNADA
jgi:20S proteasome alpha/beta subunit